MVVADSSAIAFVQTTLGTWLAKGGERNYLDDFCDSVGPVVTGLGEWLRDRWVHSYFACDRSGSATYQHNWWSTSGRIGKRTLFALLDARHVRVKRLMSGVSILGKW
jgi:hypothetical protein